MLPLLQKIKYPPPPLLLSTLPLLIVSFMKLDCRFGAECIESEGGRRRTQLQQRPGLRQCDDHLDKYNQVLQIHPDSIPLLCLPLFSPPYNTSSFTYLHFFDVVSDARESTGWYQAT